MHIFAFTQLTKMNMTLESSKNEMKTTLQWIILPLAFLAAMALFLALMATEEV